MLCWIGVNSAALRDQDLLRLLLDALEQPEEGVALPDDPRLLAVARYHRLSPLLSTLGGPAWPAPLKAAFRADRVVATARAMILGHVAQECVAALAGQGIPTILLKGLDYEGRLYHGPGLRPTGDVDVMVPHQHRRRAFAVLDRLGFEPRAAAPGFDDADYHEVAWRRRDVEVDLHMGLAPTARCRIDYAAVWEQREPFRLGTTQTAVLARSHAAVFQALHMTIDHFAVPAIYLIDLSKLLADWEALGPVQVIAAEWRCRRPLATALALTAAFLPRWGRRFPAKAGRLASGIVRAFGSTRPLPRPEQLLRKVTHFDGPVQAARYLAIQTARNVRERIEGSLRRRTARERLRLVPR